MERSHRWVLLPLAILLLAFNLIFFAAPWANTVGLWVSIFLPLIAIVYCFFALTRLGARHEVIQPFVWVFIALTSWWIGDIIWYFLGEPDISLADPLYFLGYIAFFIAGYFGVLHVKDLETLKRDGWKILVGVLVIGAPIIYYTYQAWWEPGLSLLEGAVTIGYVIADVFLLIPVVAIGVETFSGFNKKPWIILALALLIYMVGDIMYAIMYESFISPSWMEVPWTLGYLGIALALSYVGKD